MPDEEEMARRLLRVREMLDANPVPPPVSLATKRVEKTQDNRLWSPVECLVDCINDIIAGKTPCDKLFIIRVSTADEKFDVGYNACNMKASEILAALECAKAQILQEMGYLE